MPLHITISLTRVLASPLVEVLKARSDIFLDHESYSDRAIVSFMVYERLKGSESVFAPYFDSMCEPEILSDWSDFEVEELQDHFLAYNVRINSGSPSQGLDRQRLG